MAFVPPDFSVKSFIKNLVPPKYWPNCLLEIWLQRRFLAEMGRKIDFKSPVSFNEKIQCYKIYYKNPIMSEIVDKIRFKKYVEERIGKGYTAELYDTWYKKSDINFKKLTPPYVIKSNCSSFGRNLIFILDNNFNETEVLNEIKTWFSTKNPTLEINGDRYAYWDVKPAVLVEEYIPSTHTGATDYKFFCFDGVPHCVVAIEGRFENNKVETRYDMDWNIVQLSSNNAKVQSISKPIHFDEMVKIAKKLSAEFPFVRVDFYDTADRPVLSEMTFYSGGGYNHYNPESYDYELGKLFNIPDKNDIRNILN